MAKRPKLSRFLLTNMGNQTGSLLEIVRRSKLRNLADRSLQRHGSSSRIHSLKGVNMRYVEFRDAIRGELSRTPAGLTWVELRSRLSLSYERPCPEWIRRLEEDIDLRRVTGEGRAKIWKIVGE